MAMILMIICNGSNIKLPPTMKLMLMLFASNYCILTREIRTNKHYAIVQVDYIAHCAIGEFDLIDILLVFC